MLRRVVRGNQQRRLRFGGEHIPALAAFLLQAGRLEEAENEARQAISYYELWLKDDPDNVWIRNKRYLLSETHRQLGSVLVRRGKRESAEREFRVALELARELRNEFPETVKYFQWENSSRKALADVLRSTGRPGEAETLLREPATQMRPRTATEFVQRARLYQELHEYENALADYEAAGKLSADAQMLGDRHAELARAVGVSKSQSRLPGPGGDASKALAIARRAVELAPTQFLPHLALAEQLLGLQRWEEALNAANEAVILCPEKWWLYKQRTQAHFYLGRYAETLADSLRLTPHRAGGR